MNLLGVVTLDFIKHLRAGTKGWQISPLVTDLHFRLEHDILVNIRPVPASTSPDLFFENNQPDADATIISIKRPKKRLRMVGLRFKGPDGVVKLSYWRANGYVQHQEKFGRNWFGLLTDEAPEPAAEYNKLLICRLVRIQRGNKGKKTRCIDSFDISIPYEDTVKCLIPIIVQTIEKSDNWIGRGRQEEFNKLHNSPVAIDLDGKNYSMEHPHWH